MYVIVPSKYVDWLIYGNDTGTELVFDNLNLIDFTNLNIMFIYLLGWNGSSVNRPPYNDLL